MLDPVPGVGVDPGDDSVEDPDVDPDGDTLEDGILEDTDD